ncbi:MBL fold metallo-hydrolase [Streptomyces sp. NPDC049577]|uniref:MBL fold metallo-hydrolase n=1 Tax=Streptomyces sp. NPDC049577 TaxID=3155153 RepID=UPI00343FF9C1
METTEVIPGIWMLRFPVGQAYAIRVPDGWALVDTGSAGYAQEILDALAGLGAGPADLREILLTHSHNDHTGSAAALAAATGATVLAAVEEAPVIRGERPEPAPVLLDWERPLYDAVAPGVPPGPPCRVDRTLADGDSLGWGPGARVVHVPGHTAGSIAVHLPHLGALFTGDTIAHADPHGVILGVFNVDRAQAIESFRRQAALDVEVACFGHGDPVTSGAGKALRTAVAQLAG